MEYDRAQLKREVKLSMKYTRPSPMLVTLLFTAVVSVGTWLINTALGGLLTGRLGSWSAMVLAYIEAGYEVDEAMEQAMLTLLSMGPGALFSVIVGGMVLSILVSLWQSTMGVGYEGWCLSMVRNEHPPLGRIFCALPQFVQVLVTRVLTGIFEVLWSLLVGVGYVVILFIAVFLDIPVLTVLLVVADVVFLVLGVIWVTMRYALVDFLLLDRGLSGMEAIRESKRLMQGNIGRGFVLQLSFFGWYLLSGAMLLVPTIAIGVPVALSNSLDVLAGGIAVLSLVMIAGGIGVLILSLWLQPYTAGAMARFYDWTQGRAAGSGSGPSYGGGSGGWGQPTDYNWTTGPTSGTGTGMGPGAGSGGSAPRPPKPRDDPWN